MAKFQQASRPIAISTLFGEDVLVLQRFHGMEALSQLFEYELEMFSEDDGLDPREIVGQNVTFRLDQDGQKTRYYNGYVREFRHCGWADQATNYRALVVPWLWFLTQTTDCRIFQEKSTPEIVEQIFKDLGFQDFKLKLSGNYPSHEYCVQYRETDFA
ncbi:MAG: type VI secretion system tip protein VgrG, partial [Pirellulales bacterium]|nr:type VI secretion system tip protein VgrG [Pirellulales bacterium]